MSTQSKTAATTATEVRALNPIEELFNGTPDEKRGWAWLNINGKNVKIVRGLDSSGAQYTPVYYAPEVSGIASLFADNEFSKAWEVEEN